MSTLSQGFRSFKEGLDWKLITDYWRAVREHAWELFWGGGVPGIVFTTYTLYYAPARPYITWAIAWAILVAGYYIWRADHVRLQTKLAIGEVSIQKWVIAQGMTNAGHHAKAYYFEVINTSEGTTIQDVHVQLRRISPEAPDLDWLPVHLHLKHDNRSKPEDLAKSFNLNPGEPVNVDLVSAIEGDNRFCVNHIVAYANGYVTYDTNGHRLQVTVTAKDMPALPIWFKVWRDDAGWLMCEVENEGSAI